MGEQRPLILLVDDEMNARESMRTLFESHNCSVTPVDNFDSALKELAGRDNFDLIVTDINLGTPNTDKSGIALARIVRMSNRTLPLAAYSGAINAADIDPDDFRIFDVYLNKSRADAIATQRFIQKCVSLVGTRRHADALAIKQPSHNELESFENALLSKFDTRYIRRPSLRQLIGVTVAVVGFVGSVVTIIAYFK